jgi:secreted Zn-dependent insulinase-like peptidase
MTPMAALPKVLRIWPFWVLLMMAAVTAQAANTVIKSPHDPRSYETLVLDNGLKVVLVSDPSTDKAAASLDVNIGSGSDPEGRDGLAHFLEHMLFLGTEKYPDSSEYKDFMAAHGGSDNAYTAYDHTNYFFDIDKDHLEPALDRFSQFFVAPTFTPKYVSRERQVVHSEYMSKVKSDGRRSFYANKQAMNPDHPYTRFSVGSNETLADREGASIRDELIRFYNDHYSANIMTLAVVGKEPLSTLKEWARKKFSGIPNTGKTRLESDVPLFTPGKLPARVNIEPIKDRRNLSLNFPVPSVEKHVRSKPTQYISHLLGHEGPGSLLSLLKQKGWSDGLSAGLGVSLPKSATVNVSVKLTPAGLEHVNEIVAYVFRYIDMIRTSGVSKWTFDEQQQLGELHFLYAEKMEPISLARSLASDFHLTPSDQLLREPYALDEFDPALIQEYLSYMRPDNMLLTVSAKGLDTDRRTDWYSVDYSIQSIDDKTLAAWTSPPRDPSLALPGPNNFVPRNLALKTSDEAGDVPEMIETRPGFELWHQLDTEFGLPLANFYFTVRSPVANDSARHAVLTSLYVQLVNDQLTEFSYDADLAGLSYSLYKHIRGFTVRVSGYDDKQAELVERIVSALRRPEIADDRFDIAKENTIRGLRKTGKDSPYRLAIDEIRLLLTEPSWSEKQLLEAIADVSAQDVRQFIPQLLGELTVVALAHGNVNREDALALAAIVEQGLVKPATPVAVPSGQVVKLAGGDSYVRDVDNAQDDSALALYYQGPDMAFSSRAKVALLMNMIGPAFFEALRTEKELGYIVFASPMSILERPGMAFVVQSPIADPGALQHHIEVFLDEYSSDIAALDEATLQQHKISLLSDLLEADGTLDDRTNRYWNELDREHYDFDLRERLAAAINDVTLAELKASYESLLRSSNSKRLIVRAPGLRHNVAAGTYGGSEATVILNAPSFRQEKGFFSG